MRRADSYWLIEGKTTQVIPTSVSSGSPFQIKSDPRTTNLSVGLIAGGKAQRVDGLMAALEAVSGVTRGTANVVPDLILDTPFEEPRWNPSRTPFLRYLESAAKLEGEASVNGAACYRVRSVRETATWTLWIDSATYLPRQLQTRAEGGQIKSSGLGLAGQIVFMESVHRIEFVHVK